MKYDDATALLRAPGDPIRQSRPRYIQQSQGIAIYEEVELRVKKFTYCTFYTGYEIMFSVNPSRQYVEINRWNGALGSWTGLNSRSGYYAQERGRD